MDKILFSKFSKNRRTQYSIMTSINERPDHTRYIVKKALSEEGRDHVLKMQDTYDRLSRYYKMDGIKVNKIVASDDRSVCFEYIEGRQLDQIINEHIDEKNYDALYQDIELLKKIVFQVEKKNFESSEGFKEIFGNIQIPSEAAATELSNIDLITTNIIINENINIVDYEWTFDFMVPLNYILFRSIFFHGKINLLTDEMKARIYEIAGITKEEFSLYLQMEENFQEHITGKVNNLGALYQEMGNANYPLGLINKKSIGYTSSVYVKKDQEKKVVKHTTMNSNIVKAQVEIIEADAEEVIICPVDSNCIIKLLSVEGKIDGVWTSLEAKETSADLVINQDYYFKGTGGQFVYDRAGMTAIRYEFQLFKWNDSLIDQIIDFIKENAQVKGELAYKQEEKDAYSNRVDQLISEINDLGVTIEQMKKNHMQVAGERDKYARLNQEAEACNALLNQENDSLREELSRVRQELQEINESVLGKVYNKIKRR